MAATWTATGARSSTSAQALTEAAPSGSSDGISLLDVLSVIPVIHAPNGQTFTGVGSLLGYVHTGTAWVRAPRADCDLASVAGLADAALPSITVDAPRGRFALIASGITLSGGAAITLDMLCVARGHPEVSV